MVRSTLGCLLAIAVLVGATVVLLERQNRLHDKKIELTAYENISSEIAQNDGWRALELATALQAGIESSDFEPAMRDTAAKRLRDALQSYGHAARLQPLDDAPVDVVFNDQDTLAAVVLTGGKGVDIWDLSEVRRVQHLPGNITRAQFSADSNLIAVTEEKPVGSRVPFGQNQPVKFELSIYEIGGSETAQVLDRLTCTGTKVFFGQTAVCNALSRDFLWGAVQTEEGSIEVFDLGESDARPHSFPLQAHESSRHIRSLEWASSAPVLLVSIQTLIRNTVDVGAVAFNATQDRWRVDYIPRQRSNTRAPESAYFPEMADYSTSISPDGVVVAVAQPRAEDGQVQMSCVNVDDGSKPCEGVIDLGMQSRSRYQAASVLLMWGAHNAVVAIGTSKAYRWRDGQGFTPLEKSPSIYASPLNPEPHVSQKGELGVIGCISDTSTSTAPPEDSDCPSAAVKIWQPDSQLVTSVPVAEYEPGLPTKLSASLRTLSVNMGSKQNPYVKIYRAGTPVHTAEDNDHSTLPDLIQEACLRLKNTPELQKMNGYGVHCPKTHPSASKGAP